MGKICACLYMVFSIFVFDTNTDFIVVIGSKKLEDSFGGTKDCNKIISYLKLFYTSATVFSTKSIQSFTFTT